MNPYCFSLLTLAFFCIFFQTNTYFYSNFFLLSWIFPAVPFLISLSELHQTRVQTKDPLSHGFLCSYAPHMTASWVGQTIWRHVTGLGEAMLHKSESAEETGETLETEAAAEERTGNSGDVLGKQKLLFQEELEKLSSTEVILLDARLLLIEFNNCVFIF